MVWISFDEHVFKHPWEKVVEAAIRKYPNPETPNVVSTDVIERKVDNEGRLSSTRVISSVWASDTIKRIAGLTGLSGLLKPIHAIEFSTVDIKNKKYELTSRNYNLMDYICIDEKLTYTAHPTLPDTTTLQQEWHITVKNLSFTGFLESVMGTSMKSMAVKGRMGIEHVIDQIKEEVANLNRMSETASQASCEMMKSIQQNLISEGKSLHDELQEFILNQQQQDQQPTAATTR